MNRDLLDKSKKSDVKENEPEIKEGVASVKDEAGASEVTPEETSRDDLLKKIEELREESKNYYDKYLRSQAEIENIIKRNKKDKEEWYKYANEGLIKELLQVIDNLENALSHSCNEKSYNAHIEGVELTLKGLKEILSKAGLSEVKTVGEDFDPCLHHAVQQEASDSMEKGKIIKEFQKGYLLNKRLIRPAMVVISKGVSDDNIPDETFQGACEENNIE
jgi:molecular chaperone GrpE